MEKGRSYFVDHYPLNPKTSRLIYKRNFAVTISSLFALALRFNFQNQLL